MIESNRTHAILLRAIDISSFSHSFEKLDAKPVKNVSFTVQIIAIYHFAQLPSVLKERCRITSQRPVDTLLIYDLLRDSHTSTRIHGVYRPCQTIPFNGIRRIRLNLPNTSFKARKYRGYRRELVSSRFYTAFVPLDCLQARNQLVRRKLISPLCPLLTLRSITYACWSRTERRN